MRTRFASLATGLCFLLATLETGCTSKAGALIPNANFVYPNSNVEILGAVSATKSKTGIFSVPQLKMQELEDLYRSALAQKGGDVLVNAKFETSITLIPLILPFMKGKYTISGSAAKMTVGRQRISDLIRDDLEKLTAEARSQGVEIEYDR